MITPALCTAGEGPEAAAPCPQSTSGPLEKDAT